MSRKATSRQADTHCACSRVLSVIRYVSCVCGCLPMLSATCCAVEVTSAKLHPLSAIAPAICGITAKHTINRYVTVSTSKLAILKSENSCYLDQWYRYMLDLPSYLQMQYFLLQLYHLTLCTRTVPQSPLRPAERSVLGRAQSSPTTTILTDMPSAFARSRAMPKLSLSPV